MSFIKKIFGGKALQDLKDYSQVAVDIHSHLIPGVDDGSETLEDSVTMIKEMQKLGFKKLITTPHIMTDYYKNTPQIVNKGLEKLKKRLEKQNIDIEISAAAEYHIDCFSLKKVPHSNVMMLKDRYMLFEFSYFTKPPQLATTLFELQVSEINLILAHPERYTYFYNNMAEYLKLKDRGILFQLNINSLTGLYSREAKIMAEKLLKKGMIDLVGSDLHRIDQIQYLKQALGNKHLAEFIQSDKLQNSKLFG